MNAGCVTAFHREALLFRRRLWRQLASMSVSPLLYLIAFGYAMRGTVVDGRTYVEFLVPGLVAMTSMTQAFAIAMEINVARFYHHVFEEFQAAPIHDAGYVLGEVLAGVCRALIAVGVILLLGAAFGVVLHYGPGFWLAVLLNAFVFASIAVVCAMVVRSHADQAVMSNFVITPMAFLGGTFFPVDRLPEWAQWLVTVLPLTHAARAIRGSAFEATVGWQPFGVLVVLGLGFFLLACRCVGAARD